MMVSAQAVIFLTSVFESNLRLDSVKKLVSSYAIDKKYP